MRKPTGPGLVEPVCLPNLLGLRRLAWSLFNFDIDDASLKLEHQQFLEENVIPLLGLQGAIASLRGTASRSGAAAYNQQLATKRVDTVRKFLTSQGARVEQMTATATGEDDARIAGQADGTEDARFRAVIVEVRLPVSSVTPHFDRDDFNGQNDGFDTTDALLPPWVLVRAELGFRMVRLVNGAGFELVSTNPRVVQVEDPVIVGRPLARALRDPQFLRLRAGFLGDAEIHAIDTCGRIRARLRVAVREKLFVRAAFHYVQNAGYGTKTRKLGDEDPFLTVMNRLYLDQANIEFVKLPGSRGAHNLPLKDKLGTEINVLPNDSTEFDTLVANRHAEAQFNVFLVREVDEDAEGTLAADGTPTDTCNALTTVGGNGDCILEDNSSPAVGVTLAHEAGHCLGIRHNTPIVSAQHMLMFTNPNRGHLIPRVHAEIMRGGVRRP